MVFIYSCQISMKLDFCRQIFENYSNTKFKKKIRPMRTQLFHEERHADGWTGRLT
jgi:hypothetical protein